MGALLNPLPGERKQPAKAARPSKLNQYGRDPQSLGERARESSDYDTEKGYAPFFHAFNADWPRLSSGHVSDVLFMWVLSKSLGRSFKKGEPRPQSTLPFIVEEVASVLLCDVRSIERELAGWHARKVAKVTREGKGLVSVELLYRGWEALPNYKNMVSIETGGPSAEDATPVDAEKPQATRIELTKAPLPCKAGRRSKSVKIECGIKRFHLINPSAVDFDITAVVQAGDLGITIRATEEWLREAVKRIPVSNGINNLDSPPRHGSDGLARETIAKAKSKAKAIDYTHPRAAELAAIFDPLLKKSRARLISEDSVSLLKACEEYRSLPKDDLLHFLMAGDSPRAARPISSPKHVAAIVREAVGNWVKLGGVPDVQLPAKKQGFVDGVLSDVARRLKRDGKL